MAVMIIAMIIVCIAVIVFAIVMLVKRKEVLTSSGAENFDVFEITGGKLIVLTLSPVTYEMHEIDSISFSLMKAPRSVGVYNGVMRVIKTNGKKSRPFLFNSSAYTQKTELASTKQEVEQTIHYLMDELRQHGIQCSFTL